MLIFVILMLALESFTVCTITVTMHRVILYLVKCLLLWPLYSVHYIVQHVPIPCIHCCYCSVCFSVFYTFMKPRPLRCAVDQPRPLSRADM